MNDDATIGTIFSRRQAIGLLARTGVGFALAPGVICLADAARQARAKRDVRLIASPALTEGPFFVDEKLNRSNLLAGTQRGSVIHGKPLKLNLKLLRLSDSRFSALHGATVDVWHADAAGVYSDEDNPMNHEDTSHQRWLRGYQLTDENGLARFQTIIPGWYEGRTAHIHFKIRIPGDRSHREFTSQLFFEDAFADSIFAHAPYRSRGTDGTRNANDNIFSEPQVDGEPAGHHLTLNVVKSPDGSGYRSDFTIALTDHSFTARQNGGFGGPPPPPEW